MASQLQTAMTDHPLLAITGTLGLASIMFAYRDYRNYVSLGPHGLPDTFRGWYIQLKMIRHARKDTAVPAPYDINVAAGPFDKTSYLPQDAANALKQRPGNKAPRVPGFTAPQRQTSDQASEEMKQAMYAHLDHVASLHTPLLEIQDSVLEGPVPALCIKDFSSISDSKKPDVFRATKGEMTHVHPPDGSTHLILSLADQKRVIEMGWGLRHRLSGGGLLPWNYTFVYAPRNEREFEVWKGIVGAAVGFCAKNVGVSEQER
ncbi:hypothetical protein DE146DRAFT_654701 [Phaeosphaeria sp. MPI-PUGE-AT-0046c]|nr:hypothetical protein DE146DRAFT_654701 [Phaeosphaeria sp. MPI-PUGE-AT-0046c]